MRKLTVMIPSTFDRRDITEKLRVYLESISIGYSVFIDVFYDDKTLSIGKKRQLMVERADSEYVVGVDSDDWVSDDYISSIMTALESNPDCVGFEIECSGLKGKTASASNQWSEWGEKRGRFYYVRTPYQKNPTRRDIVLEIGYKDKRYAEDSCYSKRLKDSGLIKTEVYIPRVLYYYRYKYQNPKKKYGIK